MMDQHDTVGQDLVAMCVNDVLCHGAKPLFFLDYVASGIVEPDKIAEIVGGIADACKKSGLALIGGETAEMPGMYSKDEYDLAGFVVGIVDKSAIINGANIAVGDKIIGLASSGPHSNGYSLIRKVFFDANNYRPEDHIDRLGETLGEALLRPTTLYTQAIKQLITAVNVKGIANITGGGFIENIPRTLPDGMSAKIFKDSWTVQPVFEMIQELSGLDDTEIYNTLNMGIGMVVVVSEENQEKALSSLKEAGQEASVIGEVISGDAGVVLW
jgi:phosphoribosylformylglycinamidine cyclo-ligase